MSYDCVEDLLKALHRPATGFELVLAMARVKNKSNVYVELRNLIEAKKVVKIILHFQSCNARMSLFLHTEFHQGWKQREVFIK